MAQIEKTRDTQGWWATNRKSASGSANWYNHFGKLVVFPNLEHTHVSYDSNFTPRNTQKCMWVCAQGHV